MVKYGGFRRASPGFRYRHITMVSGLWDIVHLRGVEAERGLAVGRGVGTTGGRSWNAPHIGDGGYGTTIWRPMIWRPPYGDL